MASKIDYSKIGAVCRRCAKDARLTKQREINKELVDENESLKADIASLRSLVKETAYAIPPAYLMPCVGCDDTCKYRVDCSVLKRRALVAKAREVCK